MDAHIPQKSVDPHLPSSFDSRKVEINSHFERDVEESSGLISPRRQIEATMYQVILQLLGLALTLWITFLARPGSSKVSNLHFILLFSYLMATTVKETIVTALSVPMFSF